MDNNSQSPKMQIALPTVPLFDSHACAGLYGWSYRGIRYLRSTDRVGYVPTSKLLNTPKREEPLSSINYMPVPHRPSLTIEYPHTCDSDRDRKVGNSRNDRMSDVAQGDHDR